MKKKYVEAFYPGEYSPTHYDGSDPENGWQKVAKPQLMKAPVYNGPEGRTSVPIHTLRHVTHIKTAPKIRPGREQTHYTFTSKAKCGKLYNSENDGSYRKFSENTFHKIEHYERVLEGNLSWWGVDAYSWYHSEEVPGKEFNLVVSTLRSNHIYVSPFMATARESRYGKWGFLANFKDLLKDYKESRTDIEDSQDRAVFLRVGGTLRYRHEICYVVIVCTKHDKELEDCYPSLHTQPNVIFDHNGVFLPSGEVDFESNHTLHFKPKYFIKSVYPQKSFSYEEPAFAFYYPENGPASCLKCPSTNVHEVEMDHDCENFKCHMKT